MLFLFPRVINNNFLSEIDFLRLFTDFVGRQESKDQEEKRKKEKAVFLANT